VDRLLQRFAGIELRFVAEMREKYAAGARISATKRPAWGAGVCGQHTSATHIRAWLPHVVCQSGGSPFVRRLAGVELDVAQDSDGGASMSAAAAAATAEWQQPCSSAPPPQFGQCFGCHEDVKDAPSSSRCACGAVLW
jgi:hypothetical protein